VYRAIASIQANLNDIKRFHTDRGKEFDNKLISEVLETSGIQRLLSVKGCPYDNTVAEVMFKVFKTEFRQWSSFFFP
jgi:putative transposase